MADNTKNQDQSHDDSPQNLKPSQADRGKNGRKAVTALSGIIIILLAVLYLSLTSNSNSKKSEEKPPSQATTTSQSRLVSDFDAGQGLAQMPAEMEETGFAGFAGASDGKKGGTGAARSDSGLNGISVEYDVAADIDKEGFFQRADTTLKGGWVSPYTVEKGRAYELKTGTVVPGILVSGINSDLPGNIIAQVSQNVYDTATGRYLLIPQGAKLFGVYDSRVAYGQSRVLVAWNRVVSPDGSSVTLGSMPGTDIGGFAGFEDQVNNHYLRIFGSAALMSLITGGMSYAVDEMSNTSNNDNSTSVQDEMASAFANQMGQTTLTLLQKNLNIAPTLEIRQGFQFNIIITKDVVFPNAYNGR